ncbi:MAG: potassium channel family protein [Candidatus Krumholzibacteriia bacterium]
MQRVAVFGLGQFGASVARRLYTEGIEVLAVDRDLRLVEEIQDEVTVAVAFDASSRENLLAYDVPNMDAVVIAIGTNFEATVLVTVQAKQMGVPLIVVKALNPLRRQVLLSIGADRVVMPEEEMGTRLAEQLVHESVVDYVELPRGFSLRRIAVQPPWIDRTLSELSLLRTEKLNLVQVVRARTGAHEPELVPVPHGDIRLHAGDRIDVIGPDEVLARYLT